MAYIVPRSRGRWELRRAALRREGPRSETLLSFAVLTQAGVEHAVERSGGTLSAEEVRAAALRAGAPVELASAHRPAAELMGELARGATLPDGWRTALVEQLTSGRSDDAAQIGEWAGADAGQRGEALHDLLLLADALPARTSAAPQELRFPGFATRPG